MSRSLRSKTIRLAYQKPELRPHLLPLLKEGAHKEAAYLWYQDWFSITHGLLGLYMASKMAWATITETKEVDIGNLERLEKILKEQKQVLSEQQDQLERLVNKGSVPKGETTVLDQKMSDLFVRAERGEHDVQALKDRTREIERKAENLEKRMVFEERRLRNLEKKKEPTEKDKEELAQLRDLAKEHPKKLLELAKEQDEIKVHLLDLVDGNKIGDLRAVLYRTGTMSEAFRRHYIPQTLRRIERMEKEIEIARPKGAGIAAQIYKLLTKKII